MVNAMGKSKRIRRKFPMIYDYSKLRGKIREVFAREKDFAVALNITHATLSGKFNGRSRFKQEEMLRGLRLLNVDVSEIGDYFFKEKTTKRRTSTTQLTL